MKAEPQPNYDVNRASGTDSAIGCWLRRLVRHLVKVCWTNLGHVYVSLDVQETENGQRQNADNKSNDANPETNKLIKMWGSSSYAVSAGKLNGDGVKNRNLGESPYHAENTRNSTGHPCRLDKPGSLWVRADDRIAERDRKRQKPNRNAYDSICELIDSLISLLCVFAGWVAHKRVAKMPNDGTQP